MITNARALRPIFVPAELHHREGEIEHLSSCLKPIRMGLQGEDTLITASSGSGKTTLARYTVHQLESATLDVRTGYVNCISDSSRTGTMHALLRDAGVGVDIALDAASVSQYLTRLRKLDEHLVFVIDEVDVLADPDLLVALYEEPNITMLMVCADEDDFLASAKSRVQSRVRTAMKLRLDKYRQKELVDIVRGRVEAGPSARHGRRRDDSAHRGPRGGGRAVRNRSAPAGGRACRD